MELIRVTGTRTERIDLRDMPDVQVVAATAFDRGDGTWVASAYAPDGATERALAAGTGTRTRRPSMAGCERSPRRIPGVPGAGAAAAHPRGPGSAVPAGHRRCRDQSRGGGHRRGSRPGMGA